MCRWMKKRTRSINGYASQTMLVLFLFTLMLVSLLSVYSVQRAGLYAAMEQSTIDLSCISHAKAMIRNNTMVRKCGYEESRLIVFKEEWFDDRKVVFEDLGTYISCSYFKDGKTVEMKIFYSDNAIVSIES